MQNTVWGQNRYFMNHTAKTALQMQKCKFKSFFFRYETIKLSDKILMETN